jgi:hypothetical protein
MVKNAFEYFVISAHHLRNFPLRQVRVIKEKTDLLLVQFHFKRR